MTDEEFDYPPGPLEEVVVAGFRQSSTLELDSSITVLNRETIESASLQHFEELISLVPNMNFSGDGARARYFQMRGIGELEQYEGAPNPSIGFIVDDIDLSGVGGISTCSTCNQVEVLRGPQATRFGASALAGLVYVQSADPTADFDMNAEVLAGNDDTFAAGAGRRWRHDANTSAAAFPSTTTRAMVFTTTLRWASMTVMNAMNGPAGENSCGKSATAGKPN